MVKFPEGVLPPDEQCSFNMRLEVASATLCGARLALAAINHKKLRDELMAMKVASGRVGVSMPYPMVLLISMLEEWQDVEKHIAVLEAQAGLKVPR